MDVSICFIAVVVIEVVAVAMKYLLVCCPLSYCRSSTVFLFSKMSSILNCFHFSMLKCVSFNCRHPGNTESNFELGCIVKKMSVLIREQLLCDVKFREFYFLLFGSLIMPFLDISRVCATAFCYKYRKYNIVWKCHGSEELNGLKVSIYLHCPYLGHDFLCSTIPYSYWSARKPMNIEYALYS